MALVMLLRTQRCYLIGHKFTAKTDHNSLKHLQTQPFLSSRQVRWVQTLQEFDVQIEYLPGKFNTIADILSRRPDHALKCSSCRKPAIDIATIDIFQNQDPLETQARELVARFGGTWIEGKQWVATPAAIPEILKLSHDSILGGHFGIKITKHKTERFFFWKHLSRDIERYVKSCDTCQRFKKCNQRSSGLLQPLAIPEGPWTSIAVDLATMPKSREGYNNALIIVDRFSKLKRIIPCRKEVTSQEVERYLEEHWLTLQNEIATKEIICDRDSILNSRHLRAWPESNGLKITPSTARHQQTNGLAESAVKTFKRMASCFGGFRGEKWSTITSEIEMSMNSSLCTATGSTPLQLAFRAGKDELDRARQRLIVRTQQMSQQANPKRRAHPEYQAGEWVLVKREGIKLPDAEKDGKLASPWMGPFQIKKSGAHPSNFELALPKALKCYNVFHTDRLKPYHAPNEYFPGRHDPRTTKAQHDHGTFSIEKILDFKCHHGKPVFLVQWKNYSLDWATWESAAHVFRDTDIDTRFAITHYLVSRGSVELEELASKYGFKPVSAESLLSKIGIRNSQGNPIRRACFKLPVAINSQLIKQVTPS